MDTDCIIWQGRLNQWGYGKVGGRLAHRVAYLEQVGPIPDGLELDHLCNVPACVNVDHLEPVTSAENARRSVERRTTCRAGHPYTPESTYIQPNGDRRCRVCNRLAVRRYVARKKVAA